MTIVTADNQTAGRGQGRNTWESEPGRNLLFSVKTYPKGLDARRQFVMLEAGALSVRDALSAYADGFTVKWPNDIYHNDMKISGTLSECTIVHGLVGSCIMGTGININQREFISDAPNPVSLAQILGHDVSREDILDNVLERFGRYLKWWMAANMTAFKMRILHHCTAARGFMGIVTPPAVHGRGRNGGA